MIPHHNMTALIGKLLARLKLSSLAFVLLSVVSGQYAFAADTNQVYVVGYSKGENWQPGLVLAEQTGHSQHALYLKQLFDRDVLIAEGELHGERPTDVMLLLLRAKTVADASRLAFDNPLVKSRVLKGEVQSWELGLSTVRTKTRVQRTAQSAQSFRVESLDPEAPIVLKATEH